MIKFVFLDLDDTILDFHKAEQVALANTLIHFGVEPTQNVLDLYHRINKAQWERLERGELTKMLALCWRNCRKAGNERN